MVPQGKIIVSRLGKRPGKHFLQLIFLPEIFDQRSALDGVSSVQNQRVSVLLKFSEALKHTSSPTVPRWKQMAMGVGSIVNVQNPSHGLPPYQFISDSRGEHLNHQNQHNQPDEDGSHLIPAVGVHGKDQGSSDSAGSHQTQHRSVP